MKRDLVLKSLSYVGGLFLCLVFPYILGYFFNYLGFVVHDRGNIYVFRYFMGICYIILGALILVLSSGFILLFARIIKSIYNFFGGKDKNFMNRFIDKFVDYGPEDAM